MLFRSKGFCASVTADLEAERKKGTAKWEARAKVKGKIVRKRFWADNLSDAKDRARVFFPRHKPNNITIKLIK